MFGKGKRSLNTAVFASRMSTHIRMSLFGLGTTTRGESHSVGPSTFSLGRGGHSVYFSPVLAF